MFVARGNTVVENEKREAACNKVIQFLFIRRQPVRRQSRRLASNNNFDKTGVEKFRRHLKIHAQWQIIYQLPPCWCKSANAAKERRLGIRLCNYVWPIGVALPRLCHISWLCRGQSAILAYEGVQGINIVHKINGVRVQKIGHVQKFIVRWNLWQRANWPIVNLTMEQKL